jgi:hypothetical protein
LKSIRRTLERMLGGKVDLSSRRRQKRHVQRRADAVAVLAF